MTVEYLKKATLTSKSDATEVHETVVGILNDIEAGGDAKALEYAAKFDRYEGSVMLTEAEIAAAADLVPEKLKADIRFAHANVKRFAEMQKGTVADVEIEMQPGFVAGQKAIPVDAAGCYVPGGPLQPHCLGDHDSHHGEGGRMQAHHRVFTAAPRRRRRSCDYLCRAHLRRR